MEMTERDAERQCDQERDADRRAGELELLKGFRREEAGVVADEPECVGERVEVRFVRDDHRGDLAHGASIRLSPTRPVSQAIASATQSAPAE